MESYRRPVVTVSLSKDWKTVKQYTADETTSSRGAIFHRDSRIPDQVMFLTLSQYSGLVIEVFNCVKFAAKNANEAFIYLPKEVVGKSSLNTSVRTRQRVVLGTLFFYRTSGRIVYFSSFLRSTTTESVHPHMIYRVVAHSFVSEIATAIANWSRVLKRFGPRVALSFQHHVPRYWALQRPAAS